VNLSLMEERWPDIEFRATREHSAHSSVSMSAAMATASS
jgi:hypothetical protein